MLQIYYYIYLTENLVTGRKYIGKRKCKCKTDEDTYLGSGTILKQAIAKYGTQNFKKTIIEVCSSEEECNNREKFWIGKFDAASNPDFYNIALGGDGGNTYAGLSSEELNKIRQIKSEQTKGKIIQTMEPPLPIKRVLKYLIHLDDYILFQKIARDTESLELTTLALKRFGA